MWIKTGQINKYLQKPKVALKLGIFVCLGIALFVIWYSTAGQFTAFSPSDNAYVDLGEAFLHGQLSLLEKPNPELIALQDPYDPTLRNVRYHWDFSYYEGSYYLYWGPVPALVYGALEGITHIRPSGSLMVIIAFIGLSVTLLLILYNLWRIFFPNSPGWSIGMFIGLGLLNLPFMFLLGRPVIYETSIISGQFFLLSGLSTWIIYATGTGKPAWLVITGIAWGLAIGSRYNLVASVAVYMVIIFVQMKREYEGNHLWKQIAFVLVPLLICLMGLGTYNIARFDNPFEIGWNYQLSLPEVQGDYLSLSYIPSNFFAYLIYPLKTDRSFPFVLSTLHAGQQLDELTAGLLPSVPSMWLLTLALPELFTRSASNRQQPVVPGLAKPLFFMILTAGLAQFIFLMIFFYAAMRYMADFYLPLVITIAFLTWRADEYLRVNALWRFLLWMVVSGLIFWTASIGFFGSFDIPDHIFQNTNLGLYFHLADFWNCIYELFASLF